MEKENNQIKVAVAVSVGLLTGLGGGAAAGRLTEAEFSEIINEEES